MQVVVWGAPWCKYCVQNKPELERLHRTGRYVIMFINYDEHRQFARKHGISKLPAYFVIENKRVVFKTHSLNHLKDYHASPSEKHSNLR